MAAGPAPSTRAASYGSVGSACSPPSSSRAPLRLDTGFLEHLVDFDARLLERVGRGQALEVDLVQRARPDVAGPPALGLGYPRNPRRFEVLRDGLQVAAAAPRPHDLLDARIV